MSFDHLLGKPWYRPDFSRAQAEQMLGLSPVGTFLIRPSSTPDCLALSQKADDGDIFHARILCIKRGMQYVGYSIGGDSEVFSTVDALLKRIQPKTPLVAPQPGLWPPMGAPLPPVGGGRPSVYPTQNAPHMMARGGPPQHGGGRGFNPAASGRGPRGGPPMQGGGHPGHAGGAGAAMSSGGSGARAGPNGGWADSPLASSTQIDMSELVFDKELGSGSFGTVYKGHWRQWTVGIKQLKNLVPQESKEYQEFIGEAELMTKVRPHENVVRFVGVTKPPNLCIVLEFVARGALYDYLQSPAMIGGDVMLNILRGTAAGMAHLHAEKVVHRDLAARNVLLDQNLTAKIADMGMSRVIQNTSGQGAQQTKSDTGPLKWMAPESIKNREYSYKSDVWSYGVVITEVLTRCSEPYPDLEPIQVATRVAYEDLRPPVPPGASQTVQNVLRACSERQPENRPTMQEIVGFFSWERSVFA